MNTIMKNEDKIVQFRFYEIPHNQPVFALLGERWIQNYKSEKGYMHFHNYMEIGYCYNGEGTLFLEDERIRFEDNMFSIIPANYPHMTDSDGETISRWEYLVVDVDSIVRDMVMDDEILAKELIERINKRAIFVKAKEYPEITKLILDICDEMRYKKEFYIETVRGLLRALMVNIARINKDTTDKSISQPVSVTQVGTVLDYISQNYDKKLSIADLAKAGHLSETHFRRIFEKCMNMTPVDYLNLVRVQMACEYMRNNDVSMESVAEKCGFQSVSTFNRNFRRVLGESPYQWKLKTEQNER